MAHVSRLVVAVSFLVLVGWLPEANGGASAGSGRAGFLTRFKIKFRAKEPASVTVFAEQGRGSPEVGEKVRIEVRDSAGELVTTGASLPFDFGDGKATLTTATWIAAKEDTFTVHFFSGKQEGHDRGNYRNRAFISWN